jgi:hypothetical protein
VDQQANNQTPEAPASAEPVMVPDVATHPHPSVHTPPLPGQPASPGEKGRLQEVLPEVLEVVRKVGGFKKLAELALQLDRDGQ